MKYEIYEFNKVKKKSKFNPTREFIQKAIADFKSKGGQIKKIDPIEISGGLKYRSGNAITLYDFL